jgi:hypothetical protein
MTYWTGLAWHMRAMNSFVIEDEGACIQLVFLHGLDTLKSYTTGGFPVVQFNSSQKSNVAFGIVPIAAIEDENLRDCTGPGAVADDRQSSAYQASPALVASFGRYQHQGQCRLTP